MVDRVDHPDDLVADGDSVWDLDGRAHQERHALGDRALAVAGGAEDEQRRARHHGAADLVDHVLLELELAERALQGCVGDVGLAAHLGANEAEVVVEVDRARPEIACLHRGHLGRAHAPG